jgi:hypothetical protein
VKQEASSDQFLVGSSHPILFKVWLELEGEVAPRTLVEWSTTEGVESTSYSDKDGVAVFNSKFKHGQHVVTARVSGTDDSVTFDVSAMPPVEFTVEMKKTMADENSPFLLSRSVPNNLLVKVTDESGTPIPGVEFKLDFVGEDPALMGVTIQGLGETHLSTVEGVNFGIQASPGDKGTMTLKLTGTLLEEWRETYQLGWIYKFYTSRLLLDDKLDLRWVCIASMPDPYDGPVVDNLGVITISATEQGISFPVSVKLDGRPLYLGIPPEDLSSVPNGAVMTASRLEALEGYLVVLAGQNTLTRN